MLVKELFNRNRSVAEMGDHQTSGAKWTQIYADGRRDEELVLQAFLPVLSLAPGELKNRQEWL